MKPERCPTCRAVLPPVKVCANSRCGREFYRGEGGRLDSAYCSARCATADRVRRWREKRQEGGQS